MEIEKEVIAAIIMSFYPNPPPIRSKAAETSLIVKRREGRRRRQKRAVLEMLFFNLVVFSVGGEMGEREREREIGGFFLYSRQINKPTHCGG